MTKDLFIGMMSGTSMDAIDCAVVRFIGQKPELLHLHKDPLPDSIKKRLLAITQTGYAPISELGSLDTLLGEMFADTSLKALKQLRLHPHQIKAIGSHGQTIWHQPPGSSLSSESRPFTLQIGDPNVIAERTGITTVADFRRRDMAAGGQGAPMVPAFHQHFFRHRQQLRMVVNVGGIANISLLCADTNQLDIGYDTGPGNVLMDYWTHKHLDKSFDHRGSWAASGTADTALLELLCGEPYFSSPAPKSTGTRIIQFDLAGG
jgi:anhydro-N-acetylmuramic acid kinase